MIVMGFDSSLKRSAWAAWTPEWDEEYHWSAQSFIKPADKEFPDARYSEWRQWAAFALDHFQPDLTIYEMPTPHGGGSGREQVMLLMTLRELCAVRKIPTACIYPSHLKKHITDSGKSDKSHVMAAVAERVSAYNPEDDDGGDVADALAMTLWHRDGAPPSDAEMERRAKAEKKKLAKKAVSL